MIANLHYIIGAFFVGLGIGILCGALCCAMVERMPDPTEDGSSPL